MAITRRQFIRGAGASLAVWPVLAGAQSPTGGPRIFRHGVASGDPLADRIVLWTRVTPSGATTGSVTVRWRVSSDEHFTTVVARGAAQASPERDFTVKVDVAGLRPGRPYFFAFDTGGEESAIGRARTLPAAGAARMRLAVVSCANFTSGFFNAYRNLASRPDLDAVLFLGDYIYEQANGTYGDLPGLSRAAAPAHECVTLEDYRLRYASARADGDLQALHAAHPCIAVWDDHESANDAWRDGARSHNAGEGDWADRRTAARRAFYEWLPLRETPGRSTPMYRSFRFGDLADVLMLDGRTFRDRQAPASDYAAIASPARTMLGAEQEAWLYRTLRQSARRGTGWRLLGQQVLFAPFVPSVTAAADIDSWEGYPGARGRMLDCLQHDRVPDVAVLTGDIHSSWALDLPRSPLSGYDATTGRGSLAVELVAPAVTSPVFFSRAGVRERSSTFHSASPHMKYLDGEHHGYLLLDVTRARLQADWYHLRTVIERTTDETRAASFVCERGSSRLTRV